MGLFSFIKNEGIIIFQSAKMTEEEELDTKTTAKSELEAAQKFEQLIKKFRLRVEKLKVIVDDDQVTVSGKAKDQATQEKVVLILGNTRGIATVDDQMSAAHELLESKFHTVIKDDSLKKIAEHYYHDATKDALILEANMPMLTDINSIYQGQVLRIPRLD